MCLVLVNQVRMPQAYAEDGRLLPCESPPVELLNFVEWGSLPLAFIGPSRMEGMLSGVIRRCCPFNWDVTKQLSNSTQLKGAMAMLMQGRSVTAKHPFVA